MRANNMADQVLKLFHFAPIVGFRQFAGFTAAPNPRKTR
jgi:hypothetical protein